MENNRIASLMSGVSLIVNLFKNPILKSLPSYRSITIYYTDRKRKTKFLQKIRIVSTLYDNKNFANDLLLKKNQLYSNDF
jgi:hypothetical protein